jgi:hypothetical protein
VVLVVLQEEEVPHWAIRCEEEEEAEAEGLLPV